MEDGDGSVHLHSCLALPSFLEGRLTAASTPRPPAPARWARADAPPRPAPAPGRKLLPRRPRPPRRPPGTCRRAAAGKREATLGRRRRQRGRGAGAQMGATEKGGKKSRRLFSSLRPWKATRRLWRTRSAPKAAQGECGRGRGTCYGARRARTRLQGSAVAPAAGGGIWSPPLGPGDLRAGAARPGCPAWPGRPSILTLGPCDKTSP